MDPLTAAKLNVGLACDEVHFDNVRVRVEVGNRGESQAGVPADWLQVIGGAYGSGGQYAKCEYNRDNELMRSTRGNTQKRLRASLRRREPLSITEYREPWPKAIDRRALFFLDPLNA